jgi:hypothetical protein
MIWILAGTALLLAALLGLRAFSAANPVQLARWLRYGGATLLFGLAAFTAYAGRAVVALAMAGWAILLLRGKSSTARESEEPQAATPKRAKSGLSHEEALEILGLRPECTMDEIREAHRRLMQTCHPDHGGSSYLAARINAAKDVLLS